ncbi:hypothetical protein FOZ63_002088, partial [Perkinsus olseni]
FLWTSPKFTARRHPRILSSTRRLLTVWLRSFCQMPASMFFGYRISSNPRSIATYCGSCSEWLKNCLG